VAAFYSLLAGPRNNRLVLLRDSTFKLLWGILYIHILQYGGSRYTLWLFCLLSLLRRLLFYCTIDTRIIPLFASPSSPIVFSICVCVVVSGTSICISRGRGIGLCDCICCLCGLFLVWIGWRASAQEGGGYWIIDIFEIVRRGVVLLRIERSFF